MPAVKGGDRMATRLIWLSLGLLLAGFVGGYALGGTWMSFVFYHIGGLGVLGILACGAGAIARGKGYSFRRIFWITLVLASVLGVIVTYLWSPPEDGIRPTACGGVVCLLVALTIIVTLTLMERKDANRRPLLEESRGSQ
jgi:hypothetical protein